MASISKEELEVIKKHNKAKTLKKVLSELNNIKNSKTSYQEQLLKREEDDDEESDVNFISDRDEDHRIKKTKHLKKNLEAKKPQEKITKKGSFAVKHTQKDITPTSQALRSLDHEIGGLEEISSKSSEGRNQNLTTQNAEENVEIDNPINPINAAGQTNERINEDDDVWDNRGVEIKQQAKDTGFQDRKANKSFIHRVKTGAISGKRFRNLGQVDLGRASKRAKASKIDPRDPKEFSHVEKHFARIALRDKTTIDGVNIR
ncbi:MAG: hypothetical protein ACJAZX_001542 [Rickettsiales bacterium]|jgi:hypothetical protein